MAKRLWDDEQREINRKTRQVYYREGIYPFLDDGWHDWEKPPYITGFQIERLYPKIYEDT